MARNMGRLISSKPTDQNSQNKQGEKNSNAASGSNSSNADSKGSNIAEVVQGFVQAQANITNNSASNEIINLLQQVNIKLSQLQSGSNQDQQANDNNQQSSNEKPEQQENSEQQANNMVAQELQNLFSQILQPNNTKSQNANQETDPQKESKGQSSTKAMAVQTASQVLAQAQYELANELEASLQKLKQVISDSEKIANQISNLLDESSNKK